MIRMILIIRVVFLHGIMHMFRLMSLTLRIEMLVFLDCIQMKYMAEIRMGHQIPWIMVC